MMRQLDHDIEWQYNPRKSVANVPEYALRASQLSAEARSRYKSACDIAYGKGPLATLDVFFAAQADAPVHVFLHGGYWRGRDKSDYSFIANALIPLGITTVVMNYDLCPKVPLPAIVLQVREGMRWIYSHASQFAGSGVLPRLSFSGHSAGAHLIAAALAADSGETVLPAGRSTSAVLISGIYELEPVLSISVNEEIRLRPEYVDGMSPMRHPPLADLSLDVVVGGAETPDWIQQSKAFADICQQHGLRCAYHELAGHHHYSIMTLLETPDSALASLIDGVARKSE